jgi:hypothetical protein
VGVGGSNPSSRTTPYRLLEKRRGRLPKAACSVYIVAQGVDLVKVGMSNKPEARLSSLGVSNPKALTIEHTWLLETREQAAQLERDLHQAFKWAKVARREWFGIEGRCVRTIGNFMLAGRDFAALMSAIRREWEAEKVASAAIERRKILNIRWHREEREQLADVMQVQFQVANAAHEEALALGLEPDDMDAFMASLSNKRA